MKLTEGKVTHGYTIELVLNNGRPNKDFLCQDLQVRVPLFNTAPIVDEDNKARNIILPRQQQGLSRWSPRDETVIDRGWLGVTGWR